MARPATWLPFLACILLISGVRHVKQAQDPTEAPAPGVAEATAAAIAAAKAADDAAGAATAQAAAAELKLKEVEAELNDKVATNALKTQEALSSLKITMAETLSKDNMKKTVDGYTRTGGFVSGHELGLLALLQRNGVLRGVSMLADVVDTQNGEVVKMKSQFHNDSTLVDRVVLNPDVPTLEFTIEATSTKIMQEANQEVANFGISTFQSKSWQNSLGVGLAITGAGGSGGGSGSAGFSWGGSKSSGDASETSASSTKQLTSSVQTYSRTDYFYEPRAFVALQADMFEATTDFQQAVSKLHEMQEDTASSLFKEYGTHICPRVLMGGWWRIEADFTSKSTTEMLEASKIVSRAVSSTKSSSSGYSAGVEAYKPIAPAAPAAVPAADPAALVTAAADPAAATATAAPETGGAGGAVSAGGGSGSQNKNGLAEGSGSKEMSQSVESEGTVDVNQMWRGGASGGSPAQWRESLVKDELSSNWRVIDRFSEDCVGIWHWVSDASLSKLICKGWIHQFCEEVEQAPDGTSHLVGKICDLADAAYAETAICTEPSAAQDFRTAKVAARYHELETRVRKAEEDCLEQPGHHFDGDECKLNICKCGDEVGTGGSDCPAHGEQACKEEQRADCHTISCPTDFALDPLKRFDKCKFGTCDSDADRDLCCLSRFATKDIMLEVHTGADCPGLFLDIRFEDELGQILEIESGDGEQENGTNKDPTLWRLTKRQNNGFEKSTTSRWMLVLKKPAVPMRLCVHNYENDWCPGYPLAFSVKNADMTMNNIIGNIVNLPYKLEDKDGTVCRPLMAPATG